MNAPRFITLFVAIGSFIFILTNAQENPTTDAPDTNERSIVSTSPMPSPSRPSYSSSSQDGHQEGGKKDDEEESEEGEEEGEDVEPPFPEYDDDDDGKEGEVNGGESEGELKEGESEDVVDGTSSSSEERNEEHEEGSSSENTDIGSSSDISSTSKSKNTSIVVGKSGTTDGTSDGDNDGSDSRERSGPSSKVIATDERSKEMSSNRKGAKGSASSTSSSKYSFTNCSIDTLDRCSRSLLFYGDPDLNNIPETPLQVARQCYEWRSSVKCSLDWSKKCLMGPAKLLVRSMINGPSKDVRERCSYDGTLWFLRSQRCIGIIKPEVEGTCLTRLKEGLSALLTLFGTEAKTSSPSAIEAAAETETLGNQSSNWESSGCCLFQQFNTCFETLVKEKCNFSGEEQSANFVLKLREANFGSFQNILCTENMIGKEVEGKEMRASHSGSTQNVSSNTSSFSECEGFNLSQLITNPSSMSHSSIIRQDLTTTKNEGKEKKEDDEEGGSKKLMMSQMMSKSRRYDSLLVTLLRLYQKFGKISSQDILFFN